MNAEELARKAITSAQQGDPKQAKEALQAAIKEAPDRLDLRHALTVTTLQLGDPLEALAMNQDLYDMAMEVADESAMALMAQIVLTRAAIFEDLAQPAEAEAAYREVLSNEEGHPSAQQGLGYLLMAWGRIDEGLAMLRSLASNEGEDPDVREATNKFIDAYTKFMSDDIHPKNFLQAHEESYVEFFDFHADQMTAKGWYAEAARMMRDGDRVVPVIPDGARPYAAIRLDLVDPKTGQPGLVGEEPMIVAVDGYEALGHAPVLFRAPADQPFAVWISSQCPWNNLSIQVRFHQGGAGAALDGVIGDWYTAGFEGVFGTADKGRFHTISDPISLAPDMVAYEVDCGRADLQCIENLLQRLTVLHSQQPIRHVALGRGFLPA